jgi:hypothetical protein
MSRDKPSAGLISVSALFCSPVTTGNSKIAGRIEDAACPGNRSSGYNQCLWGSFSLGAPGDSRSRGHASDATVASLIANGRRSPHP